MSQEQSDALFEYHLKERDRWPKLVEVLSSFVYDCIRNKAPFNPDLRKHYLVARAASVLPLTEHTPFICLFRVWRADYARDDAENLKLIEELPIIQEMKKEGEDFVEELKKA